MDNQENEMSLSQLFAVFKKSLIRSLIYVLVSVIFFTAVLVLVKTFTSTNVYNSTVDDTLLTSMNSYKANAVNKALKADSKSLDISDEVVKNLTVSAVIPSANEDDSSFIPTSFNVSLKSSSELKLSSGEYKSIVDNVANEFVNQFATSGMPELSKNIINVNSQLENQTEYLQIAYYFSDIIDDYILNLNSFISSNPAVASAIISHKNENGEVVSKSLNGIISDFTAIKSTIDLLKQNIAIYKYGFGKLNVYIGLAKDFVDAEVSKYETIKENANIRLANYNTTITEKARRPADDI